MRRLTRQEQNVTSLLLSQNGLQSSEIYTALTGIGESVSLITVKRLVSRMAADEWLWVTGSGRFTTYWISMAGRLATVVNAHAYMNTEPDRRFGRSSYDFDLFPHIPSQILSLEDTQTLEAATAEYRLRTTDLPETIKKKELERLVIELSWKSSRIEGNTYTLLDTEKLILENKEAPGHDHAEAQMILNHKEAFYYIRANLADYQKLSRKNIEELHTILVRGLNVNSGLRKKPVGVVGSRYLPLDHPQQIAEAVSALAVAISRLKSPYDKAILGIVGISYIQPFEDGNKRTARLMGNALLLAHGLAPLSYRSVDENDYREAMLVFYELGSIQPFKKIFVEQYDFAARNYAVV